MPICWAPSTSMSAPSPTNSDSSARTPSRPSAASNTSRRGLPPPRSADTPLALPPAVGERLVAGLEADVRRLRSQDRVQHAGRRADGLAIELDFGHPFPVEADERVEEVEEHGGVRHQSGFLAA